MTARVEESGTQDFREPPVASGIELHGTALSGDGAIVAGYGDHAGDIEAFRWEGETLDWLGFLPGGSSHSEAHGISRNGRVIVGSSDSASGTQPFRWEAGVMIGLGHLPGASSGKAWAANADGTVVVGESGGKAFIWDARQGMRDLDLVLVAAGIPRIRGWGRNARSA